MLRACLVVLAIVAAAQATCLGDAIKYYAAPNGVDVSLAALNPISTQTLTRLPICNEAFTPGSDNTYTTCCSADIFDQIKQFGESYGKAIDLITNAAEASKEALDKAESQLNNANLNALPPAYKQAFKDLINLAQDFYSQFFKNYGKCLAGYRDYLEGLLCAICRPDFFPNIGNNTGNVLEFHLSTSTCTSLVTECTPAIDSLRNFLQSYIEKVNAVAAAFLGTALPSSTIDPATFDFLNGETIQEWLCDRRIAGIAALDFLAIEGAMSEVGEYLPTIGAGGKRDTEAHLNRLRKTVHGIKRQTGVSTVNVYTASGYDASAVGASQSFLGSASTVAVSFVVVAIAAVGVMLF